MPCEAVLIEQRRWGELHSRMAAQRAAREARGIVAKAKKVERALTGGAAQDFWSLVDTSGGIDACHMWRGTVSSTWTTYPVGKFELEGCPTTLAHRIAVFLSYGSVPEEQDVVPICDEHLCCNIKHLAFAPHRGKDRTRQMVPVADYFACQ